MSRANRRRRYRRRHRKVFWKVFWKMTVVFANWMHPDATIQVEVK